MKVRVIKLFLDMKANCLRYPGAEFEASEERVAAINGSRAGQLVEAVAPEKNVQAPAQKPAAPAGKPKAAKAK